MQYESSQPSATADRVCLAVDACHPDATQDQAANQTANTACTCNGGFWGTGYECSPWTDCDANAEETSGPTAESDRGCLCIADFFGSGYDCIPVAGPCQDGTWQSSPPTASANRVCTNHSICDTNARTVSDGTNETDTVCTCEANYFGNGTHCSAWRTCGSNAEASFAGNATHDRECVCSAEFWAGDHGAGEDCTEWTGCPENAAESVAGNTGADRQCACDSGYFGDNLTAGGSCELWRECAADGEWESQAPTDTTDRICLPWTTCELGVEWIVQQGSGTRDTTCKNLTACNATTQYQVPAATQFADRTCEDLDICTYASQFESVTAAVDRNRVCTNLTICDADASETREATVEYDRQCQCNNGFWGDGVNCTEWTECDPQTGANQTEYASVQPSHDTDRVCEPLRGCG